MTTDSNRSDDETIAFIVDILVGVGGLFGIGYAGYEMGIFPEVVGSLPSIFVVGGVLLGASSVVIMESERFRVLFETSVVGIVAATAVMCLVAGIVWALSQAGPTRAIPTVLGVIAAALVTRVCVFALRQARSDNVSQ